MAKGRTNQPLNIVASEDFMGRPEIVALQAQGHSLVFLDTARMDLILAPQAHFYNADMADFLPAAITAARKRKREGKK